MDTGAIWNGEIWWEFPEIIVSAWLQVQRIIVNSDISLNLFQFCLASATMLTMRTHAIRLRPQQDLRAALESVLAEAGVSAGFVLQGIGSLSVAHIRFAGMSDATALRGDLEILTLSGSLSTGGAHLHIAVADAKGQVTGGHVAHGCIIRTTAEILVALLPDHDFSREPDIESGCNELVIRANQT